MTNIVPLSELREKIDATDQEILKLINQRADYAMEVAKTKSATGEQQSFYRPDREVLVLRRIRELNTGPLSDDTTIGFFRELMSSCLALEKPLQVAYLGPEGTFTQQAAFKHFGKAIQSVATDCINDIFWSVENDHCQFGVVPIENSTGGMITHTLDRFIDSPLNICGEVELRIHQNLLTHVDSLAEISEVFSHQQSLLQCQKWLEKHLPGVKQTAVASNTEAAKLATEQVGRAALAPELAAQLYQLKILERNIEDQQNNTTRFLIIGQKIASSTGQDKTSLLLSTGNQSGALHQILQSFADHDLSMTRIESRPSKLELWDYVFFIDIEGHGDDQGVGEALATLKRSVNMLKILGSYPKAVI